ncbi:hypothetical protein [Nocardia sp. NPDC057227]|uniref:hypothetical protein n=1 Tax=Nocardia sp. NPDC057227 TaxID=3346056 RepID=UPI003645805E
MTDPRYPEPTWVAPLWWVTGPDATTSRRALIVAWVARAQAPPRKSEFIDEMKGWSGVLGSSKPWVAGAYGAPAAQLAGKNICLDDPQAWLAVSRLYAAFVDTLARFTARFAVAAAQYRPRDIPNEFYDAVRGYELTVPPAVRAIMAGDPTPDGFGGVVDTERSAEAFVADPVANEPPHHAAAMRCYATVLRARSRSFLDDPELFAAFTERIAELARYGPLPPMAADTSAADVARADDLIVEQVRADRLHTNPHLSEAFLRTRPALLRRVQQGRPLTDATLLFTKLRSARIDSFRAEQRIREQETPLEVTELPAPRDDVAYRRVEDSGVLARARKLLAEYPAHRPGTTIDCWEKEFACTVLDEPADPDGYARLRTRVAEEWRKDRAPGAKRPEGAASATPAAAAGLVDALLFLALSSAAQAGDVPDIANSDAFTRRREETDRVLRELGYSVDDIERGER